MSDKVLIIYCKCGKSIQSVGDPAYFKGKEISQAAINGQKVETISFEDYKNIETPFLCMSVPDCPQRV